MSSDSTRVFTSAFDELLNNNRREFDQLFEKSGARAPTPNNTSTHSSARSASRVATTRLTNSRRTSITPHIESDTDSVRTLNTRFGQDWRYTIDEQHEDGDELTVLGRLKIPGKRITKAQFATAPLDSSQQHTDAKEAAFQLASNKALKQCVALL